MYMNNLKFDTITIIQPLFIPWLGFFDMMDKSDLFVILDNVQFSRQSWQQRNRIKTATGLSWLTIPIQHQFGDLVTQINIDYSDIWIKKHLSALYDSYKHAPYFEEIYTLLEWHYQRRPQFIVDFTSNLIKDIAKYLKIKTKIVHSRDLPIEKNNAQEYLIDVCNFFGATNYLNGPTGKKLYSPNEFLKHNVKLVFHDYHHPTYPQQHGDFVSHVSVIDLLFNCGSESYKVFSDPHSLPR